jgi:hypothetical protein
LTLFAFNLIFVFVFIRFGHIIFWEAFRSCEEGKSSWLKILGLDIVGFPPGIWNPANDLIVGEWSVMSAIYHALSCPSHILNDIITGLG